MKGLLAFPSAFEAIRNGFEVYDRTSEGYLVRTRTAAGWALAIVREARS